MKMSLLAAATALMLLGTAGVASAKNGNNGGHKDNGGHKEQGHGNGHSVARNHVYRDCDGVARAHHDNRNKNGKDCGGVHNRFDDDRIVRAHDARRSFAGPRYVAPRDYRYVRYTSGGRLPQGYYGSPYYGGGPGITFSANFPQGG